MRQPVGVHDAPPIAVRRAHRFHGLGQRVVGRREEVSVDIHSHADDGVTEVPLDGLGRSVRVDQEGRAGVTQVVEADRVRITASFAAFCVARDNVHEVM